MKSITSYLHALVILAAGILPAQLASGQGTWTGGGGVANQNWSDTANWSGAFVPAATTNVLFTNNTAALASSPGTVDSIVDGGFGGSINTLQFANTNTTGGAGFYHDVQIGAGQTLTVLGNLTVGYPVDVPNSQIYAEFTGAGTLAMNNPTGGLNVSQGDTGNNCASTLNLTNLDNFNATIGGITVGTYNTPNPAVARQKGYLYLAQTNVINITGNAPRAYGNEAQIEVGENLGNGSNIQVPMYLGILNMINVNTITIGGDKQGSGALLAFNPVFTNTTVLPLAVFRGTNGAASRVTTWKVGDNSNQTSTGSSTSGTVNFGNGQLDALVNTMILGEGDSGASSGSDSSSGTFTFSAGTNNVNTLYIGYRNATGGSSHPSGTMNVNGTAELVANNAICLSFNNGGSGSYASGALNINGGTVFANTITNGVTGGANTTANIAMTGGLLGITGAFGSIGTYAAPIKSLALQGGSTLQLAVNPFQTNVEVSSLTLSGGTNFISISAIPASIITYPTQIPLIAYGGSIGTSFDIGLTNSLPGTYQGYITNNVTNSSIDIVLTSGPASIPAITWNGLANNSWDLVSLDWSNSTTLVPYSDGSLVTFDDTAKGPTGINIVSGVAPTSMTFNNNSLPYAFSGGGIMGFGGLTMNGSGTILFTNSGNAFSGGVTINSGTVQFGNGGTSGTIPSLGNIVDNGNLVIDRNGNVTVPNPISGTGNLTENGTSVLALTASNSFSGTATISSGTLLVNGVLSGTLTSATGAILGGSGTNSGPVNAAGLVQPSASTGTPETFTTGPLSLSSGATLNFDLTGNNTSTGGGVNDLLQVNGNLGVNNNTISLGFIGVPISGNTYTLVNFNGAETGSFNSTVAGTHFNAVLNQSGNPVTVTLNGTGANLKWDATIATTNNLWNNGSPSNWLNLGTSSQDVFYQGDNVIFDDSVAGVSNIISIPAGASVSPTVISNSSSAVNYTITGPGQINGAVTIFKQGGSTLNLSSANVNFTGTATVSGGTLQVGNGNAFGTAGTVIVTNGGTLDLDNQGIGNIPVIVSGAGVGGNGAIINSVFSASGDQHALDLVKLSGDTTFGGTGRWDIRINGTQTASLTTTDGNLHNLTKVGTNLVALVSCVVDSSIGNIDIQNGVLGFQTTTASLSGGWFGSLTPGTHIISVENGGTLEFNTLGTAYPLYQNIDLNNGSTLLSDAGNNSVSGNITLQGNDTISVTGGTVPWLEIVGTVSGSGNLIVNGSLPLDLDIPATYTGNTLINAGILQLAQNPNTSGVEGSILNSSNIIIAANAGLDASLRDDQTLTVTNEQTLLGNGTVYGNLTVGPGGTVLAGTNFTSIGVLSITNNVTLQGNTCVKLSAAAKTNDVFSVTNGTITYGGTLTLTNVSATAFAAGNSFQIFLATNYSGAFTSIVPATPGAGLAWNTNSLPTNGVLTVVSSVVPQPGITSISLSGTQLVIKGTNGVANENYNVLTSTNLLLPLANWTVLPIGTFSGATFSITNTVNPNAPQNYYLLRVP